MLNKLITSLMVGMLFFAACTPTDDQIDILEQESNIDDFNFEIAILSDYYDAGSMMHEGESVDLFGKYYYSALGLNKPLIVIAHADGTSVDLDSYESMAMELANKGYFVASVDRKGIGFDGHNSVTSFYELLQKHLKALYLQFNGTTLYTNSLPYANPAIPDVISHDVMLIGHSAGGRAVFYEGKSAVQSLKGLSLKSMVGIAPTLGLMPGNVKPDVSGIPHFIIQGRNDNEYLPGYNVHFSIDNPYMSKVGLFETTLGWGAERGYILTPGNHLIQENSNTKTIISSIADAFLINDRNEFDDLIRYQTSADPEWNILYYRNSDDIYYQGSSGGWVFPWMLYTTKTTQGLITSEHYSQNLLGTGDDTKILHWTNALKIRSQYVGIGWVTSKPPTRTLQFDLSVDYPYNTGHYLRFNAGQLFNFDYQVFSNVGIDPTIQLIYDDGSVSNAILMSHLDCGPIRAEQITVVERNIMQTYVVPLSEFRNRTGASHIDKVKFSFGSSIGTKTVIMDDLGFMD